MKIENITFSYGIQKILSQISFNIQPGTTMAIIGPSGCGKTTLLQIMAGMLFPDSGTIHYGDLSQRMNKGDGLSLHNVGFVFQDARLLPWLTVLENVELVVKGKCKQLICDIEVLLKKTGLIHVKDFYPYMLSGGMQQRVGIARALAVFPSLLLMDEPFSSIDGCTRYLLHEELVEVTSHYPCTKVLVTHQLDDVFNLADRAILLSFDPTEVVEEIDIKSLLLEHTHLEVKQMIWKKIKPYVIKNERKMTCGTH